MMDKHVSKILLESVQMLCSAKRVLDPDDIEFNNGLYKMAHKNHPVTIWTRKSKENYIWVLNLVDELHNEWRFRYGHPEGYRSCYWVVQGSTCILDLMSHDEYEKRFGYRST